MIIGLGIAAYRAIPTPSGFTHQFGLAVAAVLPVLLLGSALFAVRGYRIDAPTLTIERLFFSTCFSFSCLQQVIRDPQICRGALRIFGNAGLFSFTGLYQKKALGRFRLFATDLSKSVVLVTDEITLVVTPEATNEFIAELHRLFPHTHVSTPSGGEKHFPSSTR